MRHLKAGRRLGVTTSHRKAMIRNMVTSLFEHGRIKTTLARAKELRKDAEKLITLSKRGDLHSIRLAMEKIRSKDVCHKLFNEIAPLNAEVNGGYTRIYKLQNRKGDNARMALIEVIHYPVEEVVAKEENQVEEKTVKLDEIEREVTAEIEKETASDDNESKAVVEEQKDDVKSKTNTTKVD